MDGPLAYAGLLARRIERLAFFDPDAREEAEHDDVLETSSLPRYASAGLRSEFGPTAGKLKGAVNVALVGSDDIRCRELSRRDYVATT